MSLATFLNQNSYIQIPLSKSGVGHFHTEGLLNDRPVSVLIDTGASNTVFSLELVQEMTLPTEKLSILGGGAGAAQFEVYQFQDAHFVIGDISPKALGFLAMDLSHVNQALALKGSTPVDAILGVDVLEAHSAVIDYGSSSLYLKS